MSWKSSSGQNFTNCFLSLYCIYNYWLLDCDIKAIASVQLFFSQNLDDIKILSKYACYYCEYQRLPYFLLVSFSNVNMWCELRRGHMIKLKVWLVIGRWSVCNKVYITCKDDIEDQTDKLHCIDYGNSVKGCLAQPYSLTPLWFWIKSRSLYSNLECGGFS